MVLALTTNQQLGLGITAAIFIAFSLLAALVIPRTRPDFPGRGGLVPFILVTVILTIAMLGAVEVFAKEEHAAAEGAAETTETETTATTETTETETTAATETTETETEPAGTTTAEEPPGSAEAGRAVFLDQGCGNCHAFPPAGSTATVGPNLEESLAGKDPAYIREAIVDPNAEVASGYSAGVMPQTYEEQLSPEQLDDVVAFLASG